MKHGLFAKVMVLFVLLLGSVFTSAASVGVGLSPSKMVVSLEGGKAHEFSLLAFNSGDRSIELSFTAEGEIAPFTTITPTSFGVEPEPIPHEQPIKNGKKFVVIFEPPATRESVKYTGTISASGSPTEGSQFGGSVGVAMQIELLITPPTSWFAFITVTHIVIVSVVLFVLIAIFLLRKAGLRISFARKE